MEIEFDIQIYTRIRMEQDGNQVISKLISKEVNDQVFENIYVPIDHNYITTFHHIRARMEPILGQ